MQIKLASLASEPPLIEMLQPCHTRPRLGTWLLGADYLLAELPWEDQASAVSAVSFVSSLVSHTCARGSS